MSNRLYTYLRYSIAAVAGVIIGAGMMFLAFAAELSQGTEFIGSGGNKVLCIRTE